MSKYFRSRIDQKTVSRETFGNTFDKAGRVFKSVLMTEFISLVTIGALLSDTIPLA